MLYSTWSTSWTPYMAGLLHSLSCGGWYLINRSHGHMHPRKSSHLAKLITMQLCLWSRGWGWSINHTPLFWCSDTVWRGWVQIELQPIIGNSSIPTIWYFKTVHDPLVHVDSVGHILAPIKHNTGVDRGEWTWCSHKIELNTENLTTCGGECEHADP